MTVVVDRPEIVEDLRTMDAPDFESFLGDLWSRQGYQTTVSSAGRDRGIDITATREVPHPEKLLIQAKRYQSGGMVGGPDIQQYASLKQQESNVDMVLVVTTGDFSEQARELAGKLNVKCINGTDLATLIQRLDATDLVERYTANPLVRGDSPNQGSDATASTIGYGGGLTVELTGYGRSRAPIKKRYFSFLNTEFDGLLLSTIIYNRDAEPMDIDRSNVYLADQLDRWHEPTPFNRDRLPHGWTCHQGASRGYLVTVSPEAPLRYLVGFEVPENVRPRLFTITSHDINVPLDELVPNQTLPFPDAIQHLIGT